MKRCLRVLCLNTSVGFKKYKISAIKQIRSITDSKFVITTPVITTQYRHYCLLSCCFKTVFYCSVKEKEHNIMKRCHRLLLLSPRFNLLNLGLFPNRKFCPLLYLLSKYAKSLYHNCTCL